MDEKSARREIVQIGKLMYDRSYVVSSRRQRQRASGCGRDLSRIDNDGKGAHDGRLSGVDRREMGSL